MALLKAFNHVGLDQKNQSIKHLEGTQRGSRYIYFNNYSWSKGNVAEYVP